MCSQAFAQTPMLSLINWGKKNGSEWSRLKHSVLFGESGRVSILLFRNYPTICFTTSGNVEGLFRLLPPSSRSRMSEKVFYELYTHTINVLLWGLWGREGSETQNRKNKALAGWCKHKAPKWEADFSSRFNSYLSLIIALDVLEFAAEKKKLSIK